MKLFSRDSAAAVETPRDESAVFLISGSAWALGGAVLAGSYGDLAAYAAEAAIAAATLRIGAAYALRGALKEGDPDSLEFWELSYGAVSGLTAGALGFLLWACFVVTTPASLKVAAAAVTFSHVLFSSGWDIARPRVVLVRAACAFVVLGGGLAWRWDQDTPIALAFLFALGFAAVSETGRQARQRGAWRETERRLALTMDASTDCIGIFDAHSRLVTGNKQFWRMFRISEATAGNVALEELMRKKLGLRVKEPGSADQVLAAAKTALARRAREALIVEAADDRYMEFAFIPAPEGFSLRIEDVTRRRQSEMRTERMARQDDVTGLSNRADFREKLEAMTARCAAEATEAAVILVDLDRFKHVNDSLGHPVGDKLLKRVAMRLSELAEETDIIARVGGDEFVILRNCDRADAALFAARVVEALGDPFHLDGVKMMIGASVGVAMTPDDGEAGDELMKAADMALYAAKDAGRGAYCFFEKEMAEKARRRQEIEHDLRIGIGRNELEVYYQPIISLTKRRISCCEALVRWRHPIRGMISPGEFIEIAEESGLIVPLGEWVLRQSLNDAKSWPRDVRVAVNFSAIQFARGNVVEMVRRALSDTKFPASRLEMEITESVLIADADSVLAAIDELREMGVRVALDDFGAGYSSLAYLGRFRPHKVKIDQSFVRDMSKNAASLAIIKAVKALVSELGIDMLVEGVETQEQLEILRRNGADEAQGYLFSKPRPAHEIARFVADPTQLIRGRQLFVDDEASWARGFERVNPAVAWFG